MLYFSEFKGGGSKPIFFVKSYRLKMHLIFHGAVTRCLPHQFRLVCVLVCIVFLVFGYRCSSNIGRNNTSMVHEYKLKNKTN